MSICVFVRAFNCFRICSGNYKHIFPIYVGVKNLCISIIITFTESKFLASDIIKIRWELLFRVAITRIINKYICCFMVNFRWRKLCNLNSFVASVPLSRYKLLPKCSAYIRVFIFPRV